MTSWSRPQHRAGVVAGLAGALGQHDDAVVVLADPELAGRADHPGGHVAVGLAGGDLEVAGQHAAGQDHHDQVAGREVVRAADDALRLAGRRWRQPTSTCAPVDGLAVLLRLGLHREHPADHERAADLLARLLDRLELEAERGQPRGELLRGDVGGQRSTYSRIQRDGVRIVGFTAPSRRPS